MLTLRPFSAFWNPTPRWIPESVASTASISAEFRCLVEAPYIPAAPLVRDNAKPQRIERGQDNTGLQFRRFQQMPPRGEPKLHVNWPADQTLVRCGFVRFSFALQTSAGSPCPVNSCSHLPIYWCGGMRSRRRTERGEYNLCFAISAIFPGSIFAAEIARLLAGSSLACALSDPSSRDRDLDPPGGRIGRLRKILFRPFSFKEKGLTPNLAVNESS